MGTGSIVSSLYGEPRASHDIDLVIAIKTKDIQSLIDTFYEPDFYLEKESIHEAIKNKSMFNLLSMNSGDKVDFWILTDDAFDQSRFSRRRKEIFMDMNFFVSQPKDIILAKLILAKKSGGNFGRRIKMATRF